MAGVSRLTRSVMAERRSFFDLRTIPESAIESIEILKDRASTTYGADAIAGVVNIKMRHDYHGAEATSSMAIRSIRIAAKFAPTSSSAWAMATLK